MPFVAVPDAIEEIRAGRIVVVVDDEDRENEGDLTIAAEKVTPVIINFMAVRGRGLICLALTPERCDYLRLPLMSPTNTSMFGTAFCESIDARDGVTTGISAADRTCTILQVVDPACRAADLARPGHMFPLRAREGGVLVRAGQTEASVDLARLAGLTPAGVICEIMNDDGTMARVPQLVEFCRRHSLKMISVADLIRYRLQHERYIRRVGEGCIDTELGSFRTYAYTSDISPEMHMALIRGEVQRGGSPMTTHIARKVTQSFQKAAPSPQPTENLSQREQEVLDCLSQGFLYKEIADKLGISYETVHTYIRRIYEKLQVRTRTEAVAKFLRRE